MAKRPILNTVERKFILFIGDLCILLITFLNIGKRVLPSYQENYLVQAAIVLFGIGLYILLAYVLEFYKLEKSSQRVSLSVLKGLFVSILFVLIFCSAIDILLPEQYVQKQLILFAFFFPIEILLWRSLFDYIFKVIPTTKNVLFLYDDYTQNKLKEYIDVINGVELSTYYQVQISHNIVSTGTEDIETYRQIYNSTLNVDSIIINTKSYDDFSEALEKIVINSVVAGKEVISFNSFYENIYEAIPVKSHNDSFYEILNLKNRKIRYLQKLVSYIINFVLSIGVGLFFLLCTPFVLILNAFLNPGPLLYSQFRVGRNGREFKIFKFRSMVVDAEKLGAKMATKNDPRITPFGRILRKFRIDELPQVLSIARGEMSFIGPRPERPNFVNQLNATTPFYNSRHLVKPGITGWAQVNYKYGENLEDSIRKLEYDLYYIKNQTITLDLRIILKTISTILFSRGT